jgi:ribonuclease HII
MTFFIGTDEAGYGPNLGPLVITATAWQFPAGTTAEQCWELLSDSICQTAPKSNDQLHVADSKQVYSSGRSIGPLERAVLAALSQTSQTPASMLELGSAICKAPFAQHYLAEPCPAPQPVGLPLKAAPESIASSSCRLRETLSESNTRLVSVQSRVVYPAEFNALVTKAGSKGRLLSAETLRLVADLVKEHCPESAVVICDKHGGRNRYDEIVSDAFGGKFVFRLEEGRQLSRYRLNQLEFRFQTKAEEHLPVALASMVSKYIREVAMMEFNAYWSNLIRDIKHTKGYPVDAARFLDEIDEVRQQQEISKESIWRCR